MTKGDRDTPAEDGTKPARRGWRDPGRWWRAVRTPLRLLHGWAVLTQHEALAVTTRALVVIGDAVFGTPQR